MGVEVRRGAGVAGRGSGVGRGRQAGGGRACSPKPLSPKPLSRHVCCASKHAPISARLGHVTQQARPSTRERFGQQASAPARVLARGLAARTSRVLWCAYWVLKCTQEDRARTATAHGLPSVAHSNFSAAIAVRTLTWVIIESLFDIAMQPDLNALMVMLAQILSLVNNADRAIGALLRNQVDLVHRVEHLASELQLQRERMATIQTTCSHIDRTMVQTTSRITEFDTDVQEFALAFDQLLTFLWQYYPVPATQTGIMHTSSSSSGDPYLPVVSTSSGHSTPLPGSALQQPPGGIRSPPEDHPPHL